MSKTLCKLCTLFKNQYVLKSSKQIVHTPIQYFDHELNKWTSELYRTQKHKYHSFSKDPNWLKYWILNFIFTQIKIALFSRRASSTCCSFIVLWNLKTCVGVIYEDKFLSKKNNFRNLFFLFCCSLFYIINVKV